MRTDDVASPIWSRRTDLNRSVWYLGFLLTFLATGDETKGAFSLVEEVARKGYSADPPLHVHSREEESFYVLEGEVTFYVGDKVVRAAAGTFVALPRGVPHRFTIDSEEARFLNMCTPPGFEGFFKELSEPAATLTLPPDAAGPPDITRLVATAARYGVEILPPKE